jgi:uncharacterized protein (DUF58 family)
MVPTPRIIVLIISGALLLLYMILAEAVGTQDVMLFVILFNLLLILLVVTDWLLTAKPAVLSVEREYEHRLSLGVENPVVLRVANSSRTALDVIVKDEPPVIFNVSEKTLRCRIPAKAVAMLRYTLKPPKRGDYSFGMVHIRYVSRLGLFMRQFHTCATNDKIRVYPNILDIRKYELLTRRGHLIEAGLKPSRAVGLGTDFESLRDYQVDDTYRRINWGATARRGRLTVNQYEVDKSQNILLVLDAGRMMSGGEAGLSKLDYAINASLLLGYVGVTHDDKVGLVAFADEVTLFLPPRKGHPQLQKILAALYNLQPAMVESDYRAACHYIAFKNRKRSLICFFTDLIDEEASNQLISHVASLTGNHLVMCITMLDTTLTIKAEKVPADSNDVYEKGVAQAVLRSRDKAIALLRNRGVIVVNVPPEEMSLSTINKYLEIKSQSKL